MGYSKHVYDIDLIGILNAIRSPKCTLKFFSEEKKNEFYRQTKVAVEDALDLDETAVDQLLLTNEPKLLHPSAQNRIYQYWLGIQLSISDPVDIALILDYHWKKAKRRTWFLKHVEFRVLTSIKKNKFFSVDEQYKSVSDWLREQNENKIIAKKSNPKSDAKLLKNKNTIVQSDQEFITVNPDVVEIVFNEFKKDITIQNMHEELLKLLTGHKIQSPILIRCKINFLVKAFDKLRKQNKIVCTKKELYCWIFDNFFFFSQKDNMYKPCRLNYLPKVGSDQKDFSPSLELKIENIFNF